MPPEVVTRLQRLIDGLVEARRELARAAEEFFRRNRAFLATRPAAPFLPMETRVSMARPKKRRRSMKGRVCRRHLKGRTR